MPKDEKAELRKLKNTEVDGLKGKLVEVRKIGAKPIYISVSKTDSIEDGLEMADIVFEDDIKIEGIKTGQRTWAEVKLKDKAYQFDKIAVTTKVSGA